MFWADFQSITACTGNYKNTEQPTENKKTPSKTNGIAKIIV